MNTRVDIRDPLKKGFRAVRSRGIFSLFGMAIAIPKGILQIAIFGGLGFGGIGALSQGADGGVSSWEAILLIVLIGSILLAGSSGIVAIAYLMNRYENGEVISLFGAWKAIRQRVKHVVVLEISLIVLTVIVGSILSVPAGLAVSRGLERLSQGFSYSALGLLLSISLVFFFLRQYAALYLSLSKISLRSALENASRLFRSHVMDTIILSVVLFFAELSLLFIVSTFFLSVWSMVGKFSHLSLDRYAVPIEWMCSLGVLSMIEAWKWASWTSFFRMIALPKDTDPVLQKTETVLQQESAVRLDEA